MSPGSCITLKFHKPLTNRDVAPINLTLRNRVLMELHHIQNDAFVGFLLGSGIGIAFSASLVGNVMSENTRHTAKLLTLAFISSGVFLMVVPGIIARRI